jgi:hypothetical protein
MICMASPVDSTATALAKIFAIEAADEPVVVDYGLKMYLTGADLSVTGPFPFRIPS